MSENKYIVGFGGGDKGGHEADDSLFSKSRLKVIELIGEGEIFGLVDGAKSIYLNNIPLQAADGTDNFKFYKFDQRLGTQSQSPFADFDDTPDPDVLNWEVTYDSPKSFIITETDVDKVRVIMKFPSVMDGGGGNISGTKIDYRIDVIKNGVTTVYGEAHSIDGKSKSAYEVQHLVDLTSYKPATSFSIKVTRLTPDSTSVNLQNKTFLQSYTKIRSVKLNYPNSALVKLEIDPEEFTGVPTRSYRVKGLKIAVPSNYDPETRTYNGSWDGGLLTKYSNNPAWVMYDVLTNHRYGLGIDPKHIDIYQLYTIGKYCDEKVDDGYGGTSNETRFAINTVIQSRVEAYRLISDLSSTFRGMTYWAGGMVGFTQDVPKNPTMIYNCANVVNGEFNYTSSSKRSRHNVVLVTWNDPNNNYKKTVEYVEDQALIRSMNGEISQIEIIAFGCTTRGQAHRAGRWVLLTESYESNLITFKVGMDSAMVLPGEVIKIQDSFRAGRRLSGRIKSRNGDGFGVTLDGPVAIEQSGATLFVKTADGSVFSSIIQNGVGTHATLSLVNSVPELAKDAVFIINEPGLVAMTARVVSVAQDKESGGFAISALQYQADKFNKIDNDGALIIDPVVSLSEYLIAPSDISFIESQMKFISPGVITSEVTVSWKGRAYEWECEYRISKGVRDATAPMGFRLKDGEKEGDWISFKASKASFKISNLLTFDIIEVSIVGISKSGNRTKKALAAYFVKGKDEIPNPPTNLTAIGGVRSVALKWTPPTDLDLKRFLIYRQDSNGSQNETPPSFADIPDREPYVAVSANANSFVDQLSKGLMSKYYWVRAQDTSGNISEPNAMAGTKGMSLYENDDIAGLLYDASKEIHDSQLYNVLGSAIKFDMWGSEGHKILSDQIGNQTADEYLTHALQNDLINLRGLAANLIDEHGRININDQQIIQLSDNDVSQSKRIDTIAVAKDKSMAAILAIYDTIIKEKESITSYLFNMIARINENFGEISTYRNIIANNAQVSIDAVDSIRTAIRENNKQVSTLLRDEITIRSNMDTSFATEIHTLGTEYRDESGFVRAAITRLDGVIIDKDVARAKELKDFRAEMVGTGDNPGLIGAAVEEMRLASIGYCEIGGSPNSSYNTKGQCEAAGGFWRGGVPIAEIVNTLQIDAGGGNKATVQEQLFALRGVLGVSHDGSPVLDSNGNRTGITAGYTLKVESGNGVVTGFGLMYDTNASTPTSRFLIRANSFAIAADANLNGGGITGIEPFVVSNGRVMIDSAIIGAATISVAQINGTIIQAANSATSNDLVPGGSAEYNPQFPGPLSHDDSVVSFVYTYPVIPPSASGSVQKTGTLRITQTCVMRYNNGQGGTGRVYNLAIYIDGGQFNHALVWDAGGNGEPTATISKEVSGIMPGVQYTIYGVWRGEHRSGDSLNGTGIVLTSNHIESDVVSNTGT